MRHTRLIFRFVIFDTANKILAILYCGVQEHWLWGAVTS